VQSTALELKCATTLEYDEIHIKPFKQTIPPEIGYAQLLRNFIEPIIATHPLVEFPQFHSFTSRGIHFKIVNTRPLGRRRIGPKTHIRCDGQLEFRNPISCELLDQLSHVPKMFEIAFPSPDELIRFERLLEKTLGNLPKLPRIDKLEWVYELAIPEEYAIRLHRFFLLWQEEEGRRVTSAENYLWIQKFIGYILEQEVPVGNVAEVWLDWLPVEVATGGVSLKCGICRSNVKEGEHLLTLPCGHKHHRGCCNTWLRKCAICPVCKSRVEEGIVEGF
jgi:hypothetical protein